MKKLFNVRFASAEKLLEEYRSVRHILCEMVKDAGIEDPFTACNESERNSRKRSFIDPILDDELFSRTQQAHGILLACRTYLRVFDAQTSLCSEVYEATRILESALERLPLQNYPHPCSPNRKLLLDVFRNRKEGPLPGMKRVKVTLLSDLHISAALLDPFRTPRSNLGEHMSRFRRHIKEYLKGAIETQGVTLDDFVSEMVAQYLEVRSASIQRGMIRSESDSTSGSARTAIHRSRGSRSPISFG